MKYPLSTFNSKRPAWRFTAHATLFLLAVFCAQAAVYWAEGGESKHLPEGIYNALHSRTPVLYFGDSVLTTTEEGQHLESTTIPTLLQARIPETPVAAIAHRAYHAGVYLAYADYMVHQPYRPRVCIFDINLRSFSTGWELRPEWQFRKEKLMLTHGLLFRIMFPALAVFKTFNLSPVTLQEFYSAPVFNGEHIVGPVRDYFGPAARSTMSDMFVFNYMYLIRKDDRQVRDLIALCQTLKSDGIEPFFYVTPVDYQTGNHYLGASFEKRIGENVAFLSQILIEAGCVPLDLSRSLGPEDFDWQGVGAPNEHLKLKGRTEVAERLSKELLKSYLP